MKSQTKSKKLNRAWLSDHLNDPYVKMAQKEGYRTRAAYKLKEMDEEFGLIGAGMTIVDLGCAPGAWCQYVRRKLAPRHAQTASNVQDLRGSIIGLDILPMEPVEGVHFIQGDFREEQVLTSLCSALEGRRVDAVLSDMAPNLSGIETSDAARMGHLVELAVQFAATHLKSQGFLIAKVFHGSGYSQLVRLFKDTFEVVKPLKPKASRDRSAENFLLGLRLKRRGVAP